MAEIFLKQRFKQVAVASTLICVANATQGQNFDYDLRPQQVSDSVWYIEAVRENFSPQNGGAIANVAFVEDGDHVVVIDSGPSKRFGEQFYKIITETTGKQPTDLLITHHHPDHALGNQAFAAANILSLPKTAQQLKSEGNAFAENLYQLVGDWMRGTEVLLPSNTLEAGPLYDDSDRLEIISLNGHTGSDLLLLDHESGILFASDLIFFQRALATPHTPGLDIWMSDIEYLRSLPFERIIPGHGPITGKNEALDQMAAYLKWLDQTLSQAASEGFTMNELRDTAIPEEFSQIALTRYELTRTIAHLYPEYELKAFSKK